MIPQNPLRFRRAKSIEYSEFITHRPRGPDRVLNFFGRRGMEITDCLLVYWRAGEIFTGCVGQRDIDIVFRGRYFYEFHCVPILKLVIC